MPWPAPVLGRRFDWCGLRIDRDGLGSGACAPRRSCDQTRDPPKNGPQEGLVGAGRRQVKPDLGLQLDHTRGDLDEAKAQGVELRYAPWRAFGHQRAQAPHQPIRAGMQKQPELVGGCLGAGGTIGSQVRLPRLDVMFRVAAPAIDVFIKDTSVSGRQARDDEAGVCSVGAGLNAGDDALDPAPARISVVGQFVRMARSSRRRRARISVPLGRLAGRRTAVTMRPSPSKTTMGWNPYSSEWALNSRSCWPPCTA